jgi:hypothetical protein
MTRGNTDGDGLTKERTFDNTPSVAAAFNQSVTNSATVNSFLQPPNVSARYHEDMIRWLTFAHQAEMLADRLKAHDQFVQYWRNAYEHAGNQIRRDLTYMIEPTKQAYRTLGNGNMQRGDTQNVGHSVSHKGPVLNFSPRY